jgi:ABC-2 type transport system permease protein
MSWQTIRTLVVKDFTLFFRNRFFAFISIAALLAYIIIYFLMPSDVDEALRIGFFAPELPPIVTDLLNEEGIAVLLVDSEEELKAAVLEAEVTAGYVLPADLMASLADGDKPDIHIYFPADLPAEAKEIYVLMLKELAFSMVGKPLNIEFTEEILGTDLVGQQIPLRDHLLPLIAVFILMMETLGLASLLSDEIEGGTIQALLITPLTIRNLFVGKGITGVSLAFFQALILVAITGGLSQQPLIILLALLLGALLVTGFGFLLASTGGDLMGILAWGVLVILILSLPAIGILFPGMITDWVKLIPSYFLVDTVNRAINYGISTSLAISNLALLLLIDLAILWLGTFALRRRFA